MLVASQLKFSKHFAEALKWLSQAPPWLAGESTFYFALSSLENGVGKTENVK